MNLPQTMYQVYQTVDFTGFSVDSSLTRLT